MSKEHVEAVSEFAAGIIKDLKKKIADLEKENRELEECLEVRACPEEVELSRNENGTLITSILDIEGDELDLTFNNDDAVEINTKEYTYITLSLTNLETLIDAIGFAQDTYEIEGLE